MKPLLTAFIAMFLIGTATGFGQNTSDPGHNSTTVDFPPGDDMTSNVLIPMPELQEVFTIQSLDGQMDVKRFEQNGCEYLSFSEIKTMPNENRFVLAHIANSKFVDAGIYKNNSNLQAMKYRNARDGLNWQSQ